MNQARSSADWPALVARVGVRLAAHPRHAVLAAVVMGLALGPVSPSALLACVALAGVATLGATHDGRLSVTVALVALLSGLGGQARLDTLQATRLRPLFGHVLRAEAVLIERPRPAPFGGASALVRVRGEVVLLRAGAAVAWPSGASVGDRLAVLGALKAPGDFARARRAHAEWRALGLRGTGRRRGGPAGAIDAVRRRAELALHQGGIPPPQAALLTGMVLGQDDALPDGMRADFRATGLSHLVAASGQNIVLLSVLVLALATALGLGLVGRWLAVLGVIALYVPLAGGGASIQRAGVMGAVGVVALLAGRPGSRWYALGVSAVVTLALDPRAVADPGWQLSYAAVVALLVVAPRWRDRLVVRRVPSALAEALAVTAAATLATAPLIALHFGRGSLVAVPANLLAAVVVAPIMWLGMTAAALGPLSTGLAGGLDAVNAYPLGYLGAVAHVGARVPYAQVSIGPLAIILGTAALCVAVRLPRAVRRLRGTWDAAVGPRRRALALIGAGGVALGLLGLDRAARALRPTRLGAPSGLRVSFLDVGQGDATLLQDGRRSILVDTGPPDSAIVGRLRRAGVQRLDLLVVTHAQADHEGGAAAVLRAMPVDLVLDGRDGVRSPDGDRFAAQASRRGTRLLSPDAGQVLRAGSLTLRVLSPRREPVSAHAGEDPNQRAIIAEAQDHGARVLLSADAESDVLTGLELRPVDLFKVPHHGSADPGLPAVLERLRPRLAVVEVGRHNSYGHPAAPTLAALRSVPAVYRTDADGTVRADLMGNRWVVRTHQ